MKPVKLFEEYIAEKLTHGVVTCDKCNWEWELTDGGHDPYVCHECWHDNDPRKQLDTI